MDARMQVHLNLLRDADGTRIKIMDYLNIPDGWVVSSKVPQGFWDACKTRAIPLRPTKLCDFLPTSATREMSRLVKKYGKDTMMVIIPDSDVLHGYSAGPILLSDLHVDAMFLLQHALIILVEDRVLSEMEQRAARMQTGFGDTD